MIIHSGTRISSLLRQNEAALEAIVTLSPAFKKLRNPILRKLMAGRASIAMAAKIGGCTPQDFFRVLEPLGFSIGSEKDVKLELEQVMPEPMKALEAHDWEELDVRPILNEGKDPLDLILKKVNAIGAGKGLRIVNSFEPTPLILLLKKKGFLVFSKQIEDNLFHTLFLKKGTADVVEIQQEDKQGDWATLLEKFKYQINEIDVRNLEMPMPMHAILDALSQLKKDNALLVHHKRVPVFLLPELEERQFDYRIQNIGEGEVNLLIFKKK